MLRREPVVDRDDAARRPRCEAAADRIVRVEAADDPAAAVQPDERGQRLVALRPVHAHADRAGRPRDEAFLDRLDVVGLAPDLGCLGVGPGAKLLERRAPRRRGGESPIDVRPQLWVESARSCVLSLTTTGEVVNTSSGTVASALRERCGVADSELGGGKAAADAGRRRAAPAGADRDDPAPRAARADLPGQRLQDDPPLDAIVRVSHRHGVVGEAYAGDEDAALAEIEQIVRDEIAPRLIGEDAFAVERCWELARPATYDILRDRRLGLVACACVDTAVWDAVGKALGQPLWRLWGGYRDTIPMISIGGYYGTDSTIADEVAELREPGSPG